MQNARGYWLFVFLSLSCTAFSQSDYQWTFDSLDTVAWRLNSAQSVSSPDLYSGPFPALNPTINLIVGKRYEVTVVNPGFHPFQFLAKGDNFSEDIVLLSQGSTVGTLETDPGINWQDDGAPLDGKIQFTMTQSILDAISGGAIIRRPGYRCEIHPNTMRGDFNVSAPTASASHWDLYQ